MGMNPGFCVSQCNFRSFFLGSSLVILLSPLTNDDSPSRTAPTTDQRGFFFCFFLFFFSHSFSSFVLFFFLFFFFFSFFLFFFSFFFLLFFLSFFFTAASV